MHLCAGPMRLLAGCVVENTTRAAAAVEAHLLQGLELLGGRGQRLVHRLVRGLWAVQLPARPACATRVNTAGRAYKYGPVGCEAVARGAVAWGGATRRRVRLCWSSCAAYTASCVATRGGRDGGGPRCPGEGTAARTSRPCACARALSSTSCACAAAKRIGKLSRTKGELSRSERGAPWPPRARPPSRGCASARTRPWPPPARGPACRA
jgi:hypothetical protein